MVVSVLGGLDGVDRWMGERTIRERKEERKEGKKEGRQVGINEGRKEGR